ncbi:MAG TPA: hypothetical protein ENK23_03585 [Sorangium sp.]|nr:hypothetical protein [Sorangium sp.]
MLTPITCEALATALAYPTEHTAAAALAGVGQLPPGHPRVVAALHAIAEQLAGGVHAAEERYTLLFDLKPVCTLNIAWHIFGDTYARGALLAQLVPELDRYGVDHRHDLPDYLPTLLRLLGRIEDDEDRQLLTHAVILPGLSKIARTLKHSKDPWALLLTALVELLEEEIPKRGRTDIPVPRRALRVLPPC